jgi:hypothetical protein
MRFAIEKAKLEAAMAELRAAKSKATHASTSATVSGVQAAQQAADNQKEIFGAASRNLDGDEEFGFIFLLPALTAAVTARAIRTRRERIKVAQRKMRRGRPLPGKLVDHLRRDKRWILNILPSIKSSRKAARLRTDLREINHILKSVGPRMGQSFLEAVAQGALNSPKQAALRWANQNHPGYDWEVTNIEPVKKGGPFPPQAVETELGERVRLVPGDHVVGVSTGSDAVVLIVKAGGRTIFWND